MNKQGTDLTTGDLMKDIISLCKQRGFVFQSSEIYGGLKSAYDYGLDCLTAALAALNAGKTRAGGKSKSQAERTGPAAGQC